MNKPRLRVVEGEQSHPRDIARQIVQKRTQQPALPVSNQHCVEGRPSLRVDEVLERSDPGCLLGKKFIDKK
jgi:hypothetical protein